MSVDPFLEPIAPRRRTGLLALVVVVVVGGVALGVAWYIATQAQVAKHARAEPAKQAPEPVPVAAEAAPLPVPPAALTSEPPAESTVAPFAPAPAVPPPPMEQVPPVENLADKVREARAWFEHDRCLPARDMCFQILEKGINVDAEVLLGEIHTALAFSRRPMPEKTDYTVQVGDTLGGLAKKFATTKEMIRRSNNFTGDVIRVGDRLRVLGARWTVEVNKGRNDLLVKMNDKFFKRYRVGTGQYSMTPTGTFHVVTRIEYPTWYRAGGAPIPYGDTNNVLGTHWISLDIPHYGIHGTWATNTLGQQSSQGCIRLLNTEVVELYLLLPEGTPVTITE